MSCLAAHVAPMKPATYARRGEKHSINWGAIILWPVVIFDYIRVKLRAGYDDAPKWAHFLSQLFRRKVLYSTIMGLCLHPDS